MYATRKQLIQGQPFAINCRDCRATHRIDSFDFECNELPNMLPQASGDTLSAFNTPDGTQTPATPLGSSSVTTLEPENVDGEREKGNLQKRLTLTFRDLTVRVTAADEALGETLLSRVDPRQLKGWFASSKQQKRVWNGFGKCEDKTLTILDNSE